jgi:polar amino acid transport system substrate-binding protein
MQGLLKTAALLAGSVLLAGPADARSFQEVRNHGTLRVGVALAAPWAMRDAGGDLSGFEIDVANKLAADMRVRAQIVVYEFDELIPALEAGEIDIVAAGLAIRSERALHVNFSQPYAAGGIALATNSARTASVERFEDLDAETHKVAAVEGSVAVTLARRLLPNASLVLFSSTEEASAALVEGSVDAYLEDEPVPTFLALEHEGTIDLPLARPLLQSRAGFAVNKGDADFLAFLNAWIIEREDDTWLPTTQRYWFKSLEWQDR